MPGEGQLTSGGLGGMGNGPTRKWMDGRQGLGEIGGGDRQCNRDLEGLAASEVGMTGL
jgi:hypothetical protein